MSKARKTKKEKIPKISEAEYAAYLTLLKGEGGEVQRADEKDVASKKS